MRGARLLSAAAGSDNGSGEAGGDAAGEGGALASVEELPEGWEEVSGAGRVVTYDLQKEATDSYLSVSTDTPSPAPSPHPSPRLPNSPTPRLT